MRHLLALAALLAAVAPAPAIFIQPVLENVPVARLIENLEKEVKDNPKKAEPLLNLARAHAMAYTKKADELETNKQGGGVWFGFEPAIVPFGAVVKTDDKDKAAKAKAHLDTAVKLYAQAVELDAKNLKARLGQAWLTAEAGQKEDAKKMLRKLIEEAWESDKKLDHLGLGGHTVTGEAGGYLTALLDKEKDKDEIADLKEKVAKLAKLPRPITPIAVPLKAGLTAADLEDTTAAVAFDADGTGVKKWSWISPQAAWLVYDPKTTGKVDSGLQLFGNVTFWMFWADGYAALRALDDDRDGRLSGNELSGLALWHDANGNGVSDPGEVKPLAEHGVTALGCRAEVLKSHPDKIAHCPTGVTFKDGTTRPTFDLILRAK
jgi:tetratricopeptide (TPR) repeat protein